MRRGPQQSVPTPRIYWVDDLCLSSALMLWRLGARDPSIEVRYLTATRWGLRLMALFGKAGPTVSQIDYNMGNMRSEDGTSIRFAYERSRLRINGEIADEIYARGGLLDRLDPRYRRDKVEVHHEKRLAVDIRPAIILTHLVDWFRKHDVGLQALDHHIVTGDGITSLLRPHVEAFGVGLTGYRRWTESGATAAVLLLCRVWGAVAKRALKSVWHGGVRPGARSSDERASIGVEYVWGCDLSRRSDLYWYEGSGIELLRVVIYFQRSDRPPTRDALAFIQALGLRAVIVSRWRPPGAYFARALRTGLALTGLLAGVLLNRRSSETWEWLGLAQLLPRADFWEAFFRAQGLRVNTSHTSAHSPELIAQTIGMELAGGIDVHTHYSHYSFITASAIKAHHVLFMWGPHYLPFLVRDRSRINHVVLCGYVMDHLFEISREKARAVRGPLIEHGAERVVSLFDSSFSVSMSHQSREMVSEFYRAFLEEVLADDGLGLVIKPKKGTVFNRLPEIAQLLERARSTGRCVILDQLQEGTFSYGPCDAALSSDLAVGFYINSAAVEAALAGVPAVHMDFTRNRLSSFYEWGNGKVVFDDVDRLLSAVRRYWDTRDGIGDHSPVLSEIDPFRDGKAGVRVGGYLKAFVEAIDQGATRQAALLSANRAYRAEWGPDKVVDCGT